MADIYGGTDGDVTATGFNADIDGWTMTVGAEDTIQYRTFSSDWKSKKNVGYGGSGQFTGTIQFDASSTQPVPTATGGTVLPSSFEGISFTLTATSGCTLTFTGNITTVDLNRQASDRMTGTFRFEADGAVDVTWDETP